VCQSQLKDEDEEEEALSSQAQRQKISFLENNLDQLTKVQSVNQFIDIRQLKGWITQPHTQSQCKLFKE